MGNRCFLAAFLTWSARRWLVALGVAVGTYLFFGWSTAVLANPVFGREIPPTPWSPQVLLATAVLSGLLSATYVRNDGPAPLRIGPVEPAPGTRTARAGAIGSLLAYLAIGCPVCNKLALLLLGSTGALNLYAPIQPWLGAIGIGLLAVALIVRLRGEISCATLALARSSRPGAGALTTEEILAALPATTPPGRPEGPAEPTISERP
ncbi:MAG: hypothetical protein MUD13_06720 [Candidatus Nanopelagicales bacterium]|jgi:hypothetical protein|nr:hypothetical protein [Candidatus Nanopelagicales bacterium]